MTRQFLEISLRAYDPDEAIVAQLNVCAKKMLDLALRPTVEGMTHTFNPVPGVSIDKVVGIQHVDSALNMDDRRRLVFMLHAKFAVVLDDPVVPAMVTAPLPSLLCPVSST